MKNIVYLILPVLCIGCSERLYQMAFCSDRDGDLDICLISSEGGNVQNLTTSGITEYNLTWSKDGSEIYYTSYEKDSRTVNSINIFNRSVRTIIQDSSILSVVDVSDDQSTLIISSKYHHPKGELYLFNPASGSTTRLTNNSFYEAGAKFSPGEQSIVASIQTKASDSINHSGIAEIFSIDISTGKALQITNLGGFNGLPEFSPDGTKIAFHHCEENSCDIYLMDTDGANVQNLTVEKDDNRWPRWSPDGKWIAFTKTIDGNSDIYFISRRGKKIRPIIASEFRDEIAIFRPN